MKKRLAFVVAVMAAGAPCAVLAQSAGDPGKMFMINSVIPGVVSFSGEGTATFNNSSSTANSFQVGSSTNFGVSGNVSSTPDYAVDSSALFKLATANELTGQGGSQLQQTIGTSSSAANTQAASQSAATAANSIATTKTENAFGSNFADFAARSGNTVTGGTINTSGTAGSASVGIENPNGGSAIKTEASYTAAKNDFQQKAVTEAYSAVTESATASSSNAASGQGIIEGNFLTSNTSRSSIGATAGSSSGNTAAATAKVEETMGNNYSDYSTKFAQFAGSDGKITTSGEISAAKAAGLDFNVTASGGGSSATIEAGSKLSADSYSAKKTEKIDSVFSELQNAAASQGSAENKSEAVVQVKGVGSIATLNASGDSAFNVEVLTRLRSSIPDNNGTASGSAGGNLATSSFANQSNTQSATAFMQAFGVDTVKLKGDENGKLTSAVISGRLDVEVFATPQLAGGTGGTNLGQTPLITLPQ